MAAQNASREQSLTQENQALRERLEEAEQIIHALRHDEVDALVVSGPLGDQVYTIETAERPYRLLVEQMQEAAVTLSAENFILYTNPCFVQMLEMSHEKVIAVPISSFVVEGDRPAFEALLEESRTEICRGELRLRARTGRAVPVHLTAAPLLSAAGGHRCLILTDLTEQKRQEAIVAAEQLSRTILENAAEAIVVCDAEGHIIRASQEAHLLAGQNPLLQPFARIFPLEEPASSASPEPIAPALMQPETLALPFTIVLHGEALRGLQACFRRQDGQLCHVLVTAGPLQSPSGDRIGSVITLADITEQKRHQQEIEVLNARLQQAVTETHHRVKNNLQLISAMIEMQAFEAETTRADTYLKRLSHQVRTLGMIHDLLTKQARINEQIEAVSARELLEKLLSMLQVEISPRQLCYHLDEILLPARQATSLALVTNEVISNAIKHGSGNIDVRLTVQPEEVLFEVLDDGGGFPAGFEATAAAHTGFELIASLVRIDLRGEVRYENRPEGGARVEVSIPVLGDSVARTLED